MRRPRETTRSRELRAVARDLARRLAKAEGASVALTGSAARGDASAGSDLDLWVLGARSGREHLVFRGQPVTLLRDKLVRARAFDTLCFWEVDDLLVLEDERGRFDEVKAAFGAQRQAIRRAVLESTRTDLATELRLATRGSAWQRIIFTRLAAWRLCCLWLYQHTGRRVPRLRTFEDALPRGALATLRDVLGLPATARATRRAVRLAAALHPASSAWLRQLRRVGIVVPPAPPVPREVRRRLEVGELDEASLLLRRWVRDELVARLLDGRSANDVATFAALDVPRGTRALVLAAEGLEDVAPGALAVADALFKRVSGLVRQLGLTRRALGPEVLARLSRRSS